MKCPVCRTNHLSKLYDMGFSGGSCYRCDWCGSEIMATKPVNW